MRALGTGIILLVCGLPLPGAASADPVVPGLPHEPAAPAAPTERYVVPAAAELVTAAAADWFPDGTAAWAGDAETIAGGTPREVVDRAVAALAEIRLPVARLVASIDADARRVDADAIERAAGGDAALVAWLATYAGAALADGRHFGEALAVLAAVDPAESPDPATVLFYRAVCAQRLVRLEKADGHLAALLDRTSPLPDGYAAIGRLMRADLKADRTKEVDEIARLMADAGRRLDLGDERPPTGERQDEIVRKLDELIDQLEQQQQQQQANASGQAGGAGQPGGASPADDSSVKGSTGPGEVDERSTRSGRDWGGLPPKERERAKVELGNALPADYSRLIEEFTRKRASE